MGLLLILFFNYFAMNDDQSTVVTLKVRVTPEFREKIVSTAKQNNRSMNQEIVARLEESFTIIQETKDSQQKLVESTLELQSAFKANLDLQNKLITLNKSLIEEIQQLKKAP